LKFKQLHEAFAQSCATEDILYKKTRELSKELKTQNQTIEHPSNEQQEHRTTLTSIRQNVTNLQNEVDSKTDQIKTTKSNTIQKERE
jgi:predicted  nucleic acid-binding Zn-ribbon protein